MNQKQALAKLKKLLGPKLGYRINKDAPSAEQRELNRAAFVEAKRLADEAEALRQQRLNELLGADGIYQALKANGRALAAHAEKAKAGCYGKRITVGIIGAVFFSIKAEGDNWAEVVEKVEADKAGGS